MYLTETIRPYLKAGTVTAHAGEKIAVLSIQGDVVLCQTKLGAKFSVHASKLSEYRPEVVPEIAMTDTQARIVAFMRDNVGSFLRPHKHQSGAKIYRLLDCRINPIMNVAVVDVAYLYESGILHFNSDHTYTL